MILKDTPRSLEAKTACSHCPQTGNRTDISVGAVDTQDMLRGRYNTNYKQMSCHNQKSFKVTYLQLSESEIIQKLHTFSCRNQKSFKSYIPSAVTIRNHSKVTYLQMSESEIIQKLHTFSCHNQKSFKSYIPSAVTIRNHSKVTYLQLSESETIQKLHTFSCRNQKSFKSYIPSAVHRPSQLGPVDTDLEVV